MRLSFISSSSPYKNVGAWGSEVREFTLSEAVLMARYCRTSRKSLAGAGPGIYAKRETLSIAQRLSRQSFAGNGLHHVRESIQLAQCGIDVRRNANALKLFVNNRRREDAMLIK